MILDMSKRIMNEVIYLKEGAVYYTDTDSLHIFEEDWEEMQVSYLEQYGKVIAGSFMGQFHNDFAGGKGKSIENYTLGKKTYVDFLDIIDKDTKQGIIHKRFKGVPQYCIDDPRDIYQRMYKGDEHQFNLLKKNDWFLTDLGEKEMAEFAMPKFIFKQMSGVESATEFKRTISTINNVPRNEVVDRKLISRIIN